MKNFTLNRLAASALILSEILLLEYLEVSDEIPWSTLLTIVKMRA
jgi:hypothetical protein